MAILAEVATAADTTMYVCLCNGITDRQVRQLGQAGIISPGSLIEALNLDDEDCCGFCMHHVGRMVAIAKGGDPMKYGKFTLDRGMTLDFDNPDNAP